MMLRQLLWIAGAAAVVNGVLFAVCRVVFLNLFGQSQCARDRRRVLAAGLRLDVAWLGLALAVTGLVLLACGEAAPRTLFRVLWLLTGLHAFVCVANLCTFAERNQSAGELLLPYLTSPYQVYLAVMPFVQRRWLFMLTLVLGIGSFVWSGLALSRFVSAEALALRASWRAAGVSFVLILLAILPTLQVVARKKASKSGKARRGWKVTTAKAKYYMQFNDYAFNQAVANPFLDFVFQQLPSHFRRTLKYRLTEAEARAVWRDLARHTPLDERYPLLRRIRGQSDSPLENLLILQVEGFSQSALEQQRAGRWAMPFVRQLATAGRYFPNTFQCANFTSGGVFSTMTSMPRATYDEPGRRFTSYELNGYYASPARIFGADGCAHYFLFGFRQSCDDFTAFAANQGCTVVDYAAFVEILKRKQQLAEADTLLGIFDSYFLDESADILLHCPTRFTAHLVTTTTHSPWAVPAWFQKPFDEPALNAFAYLDASIRKFCERLQAKPGLWEKTLLVILGDHTSVTFGSDWLERIRIPLIFHHPALPPRANPDPRRASQLDVLPSALALFPGEHWLAGMGRNLFEPAIPETGVVTGTNINGYFLKDDLVLAYDPLERESKLFELTGSAMKTSETGGQNAEAAARLRKEYFAAIELAKRLALGKQIFPRSRDVLEALARSDSVGNSVTLPRT